MFSAKDKRKLRALQQDGYLSSDNPLSKGVLRAVHAADSDPRPEWLEAFLTLAVDASEAVETPATAEEWILDKATDEHAVFALFGRAEIGSRARAPHVLRQWLRQGLSASPASVAAACDVAVSWASEVRSVWEDELRALLQEAACLGLNGEDLYAACNPVLPYPTRLIERLNELREARGAKGGMLRKEFERWLKSQWDEYKRRNQSKWDTDYPPRWFIRQISETA